LGLALARNASSWYSSSAPVKVVSPFFPSTSTWTVLAELWDLASMISRRECWPKSEGQVLAEVSVLLTSCKTQEPCLSWLRASGPGRRAHGSATFSKQFSANAGPTRAKRRHDFCPWLEAWRSKSQPKGRTRGLSWPRDARHCAALCCIGGADRLDESGLIDS
jgi:hypothetical protein